MLHQDRHDFSPKGEAGTEKGIGHAFISARFSERLIRVLRGQDKSPAKPNAKHCYRTGILTVDFASGSVYRQFANENNQPVGTRPTIFNRKYL